MFTQTHSNNPKLLPKIPQTFAKKHISTVLNFYPKASQWSVQPTILSFFPSISILPHNPQITPNILPQFSDYSLLSRQILSIYPNPQNFQQAPSRPHQSSLLNILLQSFTLSLKSLPQSFSTSPTFFSALEPGLDILTYS